MSLTEIDIICGIFCITCVVIFAFLGSIIISKYLEYRRREFVLFGITLIGLGEPMIGAALSFLIALITGQGLSVEIYFLISLVGTPLTLVCFVTVVADFLYKDQQKTISLIFIIYGIIFEIFLIYFLINDPSMVGVLMSVTDSEYQTFARVWMVSILLVLVIGGTLFARESLKSDSPEIKLTGKLLLPAFYIFTICGILDTALPLNAITIPLNRSFLIFSGILFYIGFTLPDPVKNFFLKRK